MNRFYDNQAALFPKTIKWFLFPVLACVLSVGSVPAAHSADSMEVVCSQTTRAAFQSCKTQIKSDYFLAQGKCLNTAEEALQEECLELAREEMHSAKKECREQKNARREVCDLLGEEAYDPAINPDNFTSMITNPYLPMTPGTTMVYEGGDERIVVLVTNDTKDVLGVECVVVRDTVTVGGELEEDTYDWYAQDSSGNVWYFGELSMSYEDGELVSLEGSWKAGVDGAKPGIVMLANPQAGTAYRQEFLLGEAEDMAMVEGEGGPVIVPFGEYPSTLQTSEWTPIDPDVLEYKYYAPEVGMVLEINLETGERVELIDHY